jgi:phospholipid/cholesterol/gamma-HCH transport system substrate-binding protein
MVGTVIILSVAVSVIGTLWLQGTNFGRPRIAVEALLESAGQLANGNQVKYRGVQIGQVADIEVLPAGDGVRVTLLLNEDLGLPDDAAVILGPESLFGDWQAEIVSQSRYPRFPFFETPDSGEGPVLVIGGYALPELSQLTASAEQISLNLADLTDRLELAFNQETADNLASAIDNIQAITQEVRTLVAQQSDVAASITSTADSALAEIEAAAVVARRSFERFEGVIDDAQIDSVLTNLRFATGGVRQIVAELADSTSGLGSTMDRADSAFARIDRITASLEAGEGTLGRLLVDSTLAVRAEGVLAQLDLLLKDVMLNPRKYVRLSIF